VVVGGGALAKDIGLRALGMGWPLLQSSGMTEACSQLATEPVDHLHSGFDPDSLERSVKFFDQHLKPTAGGE
jgi:O-succinylbenzoic acid--CoA ligase